ncbi:hypothetical protein TWF706_000081 [Orbilia oligospora]|nr:hypothetical protein TWF706_000081 [Orbilia oligospora]
MSPFSSFALFIRIYGVAGIFVFFFGSIMIWRTQLEVLSGMRDEDALAFKKWIIDECNMTAITGAIIAQLVISSLSLDLLNETHWSARACFMFSLVASLMAVYFAATQSRKIGILFKGKDIRSWMRGGQPDFTEELILAVRSAESFEDYENIRNREHMLLQNALRSASRKGRQIQKFFGRNAEDPFFSLISVSTAPAFTSLISLSAPSMLLSHSVFTFLTGIGIYLGFLYTKQLGLGSAFDDDRNVFIVYVIGLGVCITVYYAASSVRADTRDAPPGGLSVFQAFDHEFWKGVNTRRGMLEAALDKLRAQETV